MGDAARGVLEGAIRTDVHPRDAGRPVEDVFGDEGASDMEDEIGKGSGEVADLFGRGGASSVGEEICEDGPLQPLCEPEDRLRIRHRAEEDDAAARIYGDRFTGEFWVGEVDFLAGKNNRRLCIQRLAERAVEVDGAVFENRLRSHRANCFFIEVGREIDL